jgi:hypothetical protein
VKDNACESLAQNGPSASGDIPISKSRTGSTFALLKFFEPGMVKCIIEMLELVNGENASRIKQVALHLSNMAATVSPIVGYEAKAGVVCVVSFQTASWIVLRTAT